MPLAPSSLHQEEAQINSAPSAPNAAAASPLRGDGLRARTPPSRLTLVLASALLAVLNALPAHPAPRATPAASAPASAPAAAWSHYLRTMKPGAVRNLGCAHGRRAVKNPRLRDAIVILAFGRPLQRGNRYGASLFGDAFHATPDIGATGERYAEAFVRCSEGLDRARVRLALGTSNYGSQVSFSHGRAWALMVNRANERLQARGFSRKVTIVGANDIELSWNGPGVSKAWVRGYASAAWWPFFNFGDAAACPPRGNCAPGWTQEDIWYVSWGAWPAWPLPQVYNGSQALQWHRLSLYAHQRHGYRMHILGVVSQRGACIQRSDPCLGMNNSPRRAWAQLAEALNSDPRTTQPLRWVTDISWVD